MGNVWLGLRKPLSVSSLNSLYDGFLTKEKISSATKKSLSPVCLKIYLKNCGNHIATPIASTP